MGERRTEAEGSPSIDTLAWFLTLPSDPQSGPEEEAQGTLEEQCAYRLCHPNVLPMSTAEPSD
jgi:hypothetical protein